MQQDVQERVELGSTAENLKRQFFVVRFRRGDSGLNEQRREGTTIAHDDAITDDICAGGVDVVFDRPVTITQPFLMSLSRKKKPMKATKDGKTTYLVSIFSLQKPLIQSSSRPRKIYFPGSGSSNRSPLRHPPSGVRSSATGRSGESGRIQSSRRRS